MPSTTNVAAALFGGFALYKLVGYWIFKFTMQRFTVVNELSTLGKSREDGEKLKRTAVICGGSIAGLLAARVCADHFEDVLILDPDNDELVERALAAVPETIDGKANDQMGSAPRSRVMQNRMVHGTQVLNLRALERLFPDFRAWVRCVGGVIGSADIAAFFDGVAAPSVDAFKHRESAWDVFSLSRGAYEILLRALVLRTTTNVRFVRGTVIGLRRDLGGQQKIDGVMYRSGTGESVQVQAELVVDCTGVAHAGSTWLRRASFEAPRKETYNPRMRYTMVQFSIDRTRLENILPRGKLPYPFLSVSRKGGDGRVIVMSWVEHERINLNLGGWGFEGDIKTVDDMRAFTEDLKQRHNVPQCLFDMYDYLEGKPSRTSDSYVASAGTLYCVMYQEAAQALPSNFIAIGDSHMKINPVGGQGLTKAMVGAIVLDACLREERTGRCSGPFATHFFRKLTHKLGPIWTSKKHADYAFLTTEPSAGETLDAGSLMRAFQKRVFQLELGGDLNIAQRRFEVGHWMAPPTVFFSPSVLMKVAWMVVKEQLESLVHG